MFPEGRENPKRKLARKVCITLSILGDDEVLTTLSLSCLKGGMEKRRVLRGSPLFICVASLAPKDEAANVGTMPKVAVTRGLRVEPANRYISP